MLLNDFVYYFCTFCIEITGIQMVDGTVSGLLGDRTEDDLMFFFRLNKL